MKKVVLLTIATAVLALCVPAFAQFPDVPSDHWAYAAIQQLVDKGIIQGYPDGTFGGKRAMTRYEFAQALARAIPVIAGQGAGTPGQVGPQGEPGARGEKGEKGEPGITPEQLATFQRLINEFQSDLADLGVNVDALKRDVAALNERVTAVENEQQRVVFTGEANIIARGEVTNDGIVKDIDSRVLTGGKNPLSNSSFFTDYQFGVKGKVSNNINVNALIAAGNYLPFAVGTVNDFTLWTMNMNAAVNMGPLGAAQVVVGRFPFQLTPLTMKFVDPDSYTNVTKLDGGDYVVDGGRIAFNIGGASLSAFAAKAEPIADLISPDLLLNGASGVEVDQLAGARAVIGTPFHGNLGLTYVQTGLSGVDGKAEIFGADLNATVLGLGLSGEYGQTKPNDAMEANTGIVDDNNTAWNAKLNYNLGSLALAGGYTEVENNYFAPGYWSKAGRAVNLVNVKGPVANLAYNLGSKITLTADGQFLEPKDTAATVSARTSIAQGRTVNVAGGSLDKVTAWKAGVKYALTSANSVDLGYEEVKWAPTAVAGTDDTKERYISLGVGHSFNPNANLKLLYQIVDYTQGAVSPYGEDGDYRGGVATAQFQLKY